MEDVKNNELCKKCAIVPSVSPKDFVCPIVGKKVGSMGY